MPIIVERELNVQNTSTQRKTALTIAKMTNKSLLLDQWPKNGLAFMATFSNQLNWGMAAMETNISGNWLKNDMLDSTIYFVYTNLLQNIIFYKIVFHIFAFYTHSYITHFSIVNIIENVCPSKTLSLCSIKVTFSQNIVNIASEERVSTGKSCFL